MNIINKHQSNTSSWLVKVRDFSLGLLGMICIMMAIYLAWTNKLAASGILFTAGLILIIFSSLSRFESIKGMGIEAKMLVIDEKIDDLEKIKENMRNIVGLTADITFQLMGRLGRWDAEIPKNEAQLIAKNIKLQLLELGDSEDKINERMSPWHDSNLRDLIQPIYDSLMKMHQLQNQKLTSSLSELDPSLPQDAPQHQKINLLLDENKGFLELLSYYWKTNIHDFVKNIDDVIEKSPVENPLELFNLKSKLAVDVSNVKYYLANNDFKI